MIRIIKFERVVTYRCARSNVQMFECLNVWMYEWAIKRYMIQSLVQENTPTNRNIRTFEHSNIFEFKCLNVPMWCRDRWDSSCHAPAIYITSQRDRHIYQLIYLCILCVLYTIRYNISNSISSITSHSYKILEWHSSSFITPHKECHIQRETQCQLAEG